MPAASVPSQFLFKSDQPTNRDLAGRKKLVEEVARRITECTPPFAIGVHGDWGSGKTSFLAQLQYALSGTFPKFCQDEPDASGPHAGIPVIWFEAWRYQQESVPIVALLQEIRAQLPFCSKVLAKTTKLSEVAIRGAMLSLEDLTKKIGFQWSKVEQAGKEWEKDNLAYALPANTIRELLEHALKSLIPKDGRLVIIVDDLDRCESECAYRLLEGIKIYMNIPSCVFVLGMNQRAIEHTFTEKKLTGTHAREYLEKLCQVIYHLPAISNYGELLKQWLPTHASRDVCASLADRHRVLPSNPRRIRAFCNVMVRFMEAGKLAGVDFSAHEFEFPKHRKVVLVFIVCYLYVYHPELYRRLEGDPMFLEEVLNFCRKGSTPDDELRLLKLPASAVTTQESQKEATQDWQLSSNFPDPGSGGVFWAQNLFLIDRDPVFTRSEIEACLLR